METEVLIKILGPSFFFFFKNYLLGYINTREGNLVNQRTIWILAFKHCQQAFISSYPPEIFLYLWSPSLQYLRVVFFSLSLPCFPPPSPASHNLTDSHYYKISTGINRLARNMGQGARPNNHTHKKQDSGFCLFVVLWDNEEIEINIGGSHHCLIQYLWTISVENSHISGSSPPPCNVCIGILIILHAYTLYIALEYCSS